MAMLSRIIEQGFTVTLIGDGFDISPAKKLTDNQRAFLKSHKTEIVQKLRQQQAVNDRDDFDDRHYCHECTRLVNDRCVVHRYKRCDIVPRRCSDFVVRVLL